MRKQALLLSGGIESACLAWWLRPTLAYTVDYGQVVAKSEIAAARNVCSIIGIKHIVLESQAKFSQTALLSQRYANDSLPGIEFWPFRNQYIITCALMASFQEDLTELLIGTVSGDSKFQDGTKEFISALNVLIKLQEGSALVSAPAIDINTEDLIKHSATPKSILGLTFSCHTSNIPCGICPGCQKNRSALAFMYDSKM